MQAVESPSERLETAKKLGVSSVVVDVLLAQKDRASLVRWVCFDLMSGRRKKALGIDFVRAYQGGLKKKTKKKQLITMYYGTLTSSRSTLAQKTLFPSLKFSTIVIA